MLIDAHYNVEYHFAIREFKIKYSTSMQTSKSNQLDLQFLSKPTMYYLEGFQSLESVDDDVPFQYEYTKSNILTFLK